MEKFQGCRGYLSGRRSKDQPEVLTEKHVHKQNKTEPAKCQVRSSNSEYFTKSKAGMMVEGWGIQKTPSMEIMKSACILKEGLGHRDLVFEW